MRPAGPRCDGEPGSSWRSSRSRQSPNARRADAASGGGSAGSALVRLPTVPSARARAQKRWLRMNTPLPKAMPPTRIGTWFTALDTRPRHKARPRRLGLQQETSPRFHYTDSPRCMTATHLRPLILLLHRAPRAKALATRRQTIAGDAMGPQRDVCSGGAIVASAASEAVQLVGCLAATRHRQKVKASSETRSLQLRAGLAGDATGGAFCCGCSTVAPPVRSPCRRPSRRPLRVVRAPCRGLLKFSLVCGLGGGLGGLRDESLAIDLLL